jgi:hypothetical protein
MLQKSLSQHIARECIILQLKAEGESPIRLIIQDTEKILLASQTLNRIRSTDVHVEKLSDLRCSVTIVGVKMLRTFTYNARDTMVAHENTLKMNPLDIVLHQSSSGSLYTDVTKVSMPEQGILFNVRKRGSSRFQSKRRASLSRKGRRYIKELRQNKIQPKERKTVNNSSREGKTREFCMVVRIRNLYNTSWRKHTRHATLNKGTDRQDIYRCTQSIKTPS